MERRDSRGLTLPTEVDQVLAFNSTEAIFLGLAVIVLGGLASLDEKRTIVHYLLMAGAVIVLVTFALGLV